MKISHIKIKTEHSAQCVTFYTEVLGMHVKTRFNEEFISLGFENAQAILVIKSAKGSPHPRKHIGLEFETSSNRRIHKIRNELNKRNIAHMMNKTKAMDSLIFRDPENNPITVHKIH